MSDRIKLAKAMGGMATTINDGSWAYCNWPKGVPERFNPFTDANDDYAVLEWMRSDEMYVTPTYPAFCDQLLYSERGMPAYKIGDYARAALKVIDDV